MYIDTNQQNLFETISILTSEHVYKYVYNSSNNTDPD